MSGEYQYYWTQQGMTEISFIQLDPYPESGDPTHILSVFHWEVPVLLQLRRHVIEPRQDGRLMMIM